LDVTPIQGSGTFTLGAIYTLSFVLDGKMGSTGDSGTQGDTGAQGAQGDTGAQGAQGDTGAQGTLIYGDTGAPSNNFASIGSFYIDFSTGWLWRKV